MIIYFIFFIVLALWFYFLTVFKRTHLMAFYYLWGSLGVLFLLSLITKVYCPQVLVQLVVKSVRTVNSFVSDVPIDFSRGFIKINNIRLPLDYESSGTIETLTFVSLLLFFPLYRFSEKVMLVVGGFAWIFSVHLLFLLLIGIIGHQLGSSLFIMTIYLIVSRLVEYAAILILYYNVFTRPQIVRGWLNREAKEY